MSENYLPVVVGAAVVGDHILRLLFSDGMVGDVDFSAERWTGVLAPLNDSAYFTEVAVNPEAGTVMWPDGLFWLHLAAQARAPRRCGPAPKQCSWSAVSITGAMPVSGRAL
jgi:Protein of unknown function (DUF2442)